MTDETKKPDEIDQLALDAHPEEQPGNDAGGASSDEQSTGDSAAPVADGASVEGNGGAAGVVAADTSITAPEQSSSADVPQAIASSDAADAGNAAAAAADGEQAAGDAPVGGGEPLPLGAGGVIVPVADSTPEDQAQLAAADKAGATVEDESGNVVAGGAPAVVTSSPASDTPTIDPNSDEHPLKTRARWLRMKFEAEEAVVMEHIVDLLRDIEAEF